MRKLTYILAAIAATFLASCSSNTAVQDECVRNLTIQVGVANVTRATADGDGAGDCVCRYVLEVWSSGVLCERKTIENIEPGTKYVEFSLMLSVARKYDFLFWADAGADHYDASSLGCVHRVASSGANKDSNDAFYHAEIDVFPFDAFAQTIYLKRAVTQLNLITNDMDVVNEVSDLSPVRVHVKYKTQVATTFNVRDGRVSDFADREWTEDVYSTEVHDNALTLAMDYFFVDPDHQVVDISNFDIYMSNSTVINRVDLNNVTVKRNYRTNAIGNFMSKSSAHFDVILDETWDAELP